MDPIVASIQSGSCTDARTFSQIARRMDMAPPLSSHLPKAPLALGLLLGTGCDREPPPRAPASSAAVASAAIARPDESLRRLLAESAVYHTRAARRVLYSWTTGDQVTSLRTSRTLLTRDGSPDRGLGLYATLLGRRADAGDPVASMLQHKGFVRLRFAWTNPWATCCGSDGVPYGDRLIRIELRPDAWIGRIDTAMLTWRFFDLDDRPVSTASVLAHPERLAAVYFVQVPEAERHRDANLAGMSPLGHREFVLCNESMIASWSVGTREIRNAVDDAISVVLLASEWVSRDAGVVAPPLVANWNAAVVARSWTRPDPLGTVRSLYEASLAFPWGGYHPDSAALATLSARLRAIPAEDPLTVRPSASFALGVRIPIVARTARPSFEV
jgi:hypothetical protein